MSLSKRRAGCLPELWKPLPPSRPGNWVRFAPVPLANSRVSLAANHARLSSVAEPFSTTNRFVIAPAVGGIFFPLRLVLQLQGWSFSPAILHKIVQTAGRR